ncbi:MAG: hypothetical protein V6Z81_07665, partial [Parvularculales bacterium]
RQPPYPPTGTFLATCTHPSPTPHLTGHPGATTRLPAPPGYFYPVRPARNRRYNAGISQKKLPHITLP